MFSEVNTAHAKQLALLLLTLLSRPIVAQDGDSDAGQSVSSGAELLTLSEEMLAEVEGIGTIRLSLDEPFHHYGENGYPETQAGRLVVESHDDGPIVTLQNDPLPFLLYAQYSNRQRDAVFLSRTGDREDVLPNGDLVSIPFGYGSVKFSTVYVSIVESLVVPHFSDNQKEYLEFPLIDLYLGGSLGLTGAAVGLRYVYAERFVAHASTGYNPFVSPGGSGVLNRFIVPFHLGAGFRFPSPLSFLRRSNWTVGGDLMLGLGDRDGDAATASGVLAPGVFLDVELVLFDERGLERDFRNDPRPYNYNVNALLFRVAAYANLAGVTEPGWFYPSFSIGYQFNVIGPRIPEHEFKETRILYVADIYAEDLREQARRREERANR